MAGRATTVRRKVPLSGATAAVGTILRRLRGETTLLATILLVVLLTSLFLSALPRLFNQMSDDGLVYDIENASTLARNLNASILTQLEPEPEGVFAHVEQARDDFLNDLPESIQNVIVDSNWIFDSPRYAVSDVPGTPAFPIERYMRFRYQSEINDNINLIAGELPQPRDPIAPPCVGDCQPTDEVWEVFEVAISVETATLLDLVVGDMLILEPDRADPQNRGRDFASFNYSVVLEVSGIFEPLGPSEPYWFEDTRLQRVDVVETPDFTIYYVTSLISPDDYQRLLNLNSDATWNYNFRYYVDPNRFDVGGLEQLATDVRNAEFTYSGTAGQAPVGQFFLRTGLSFIFSRFESRQDQAITALSLATMGLLAVVFSVVGLLAALIVERRRASIALLRGRGASSTQLVVGQIVEGVLLATPAVLLGYVAAVLLVDARSSYWSIVAAGGMIVATTLILVLAARPYFRAPLRELEEGVTMVQRTSLRRIVLEILIVALAVAGVVLLRRRGISPEGATGEGGGFDPYLAAVPVLLGLAVGLLALRLYPLPVRLGAWLASLRRDLVLFIGLRRVAGQATTGRLPLLVILLAVALAVFATIVQGSISDGQVQSSWQATGADYRVDPPTAGASLSTSIDLSGVQGVEALAKAHLTTTTNLLTSSNRGAGNVRLLAIETPEYQQVAAGTPADPRFSDVMLDEQIITDIGRPENPIPAIISTNWPLATVPEPGETFTLKLRSLEVTFIVRDVRERFAGLPADEPFIVTSLDSLAEVNRRIEFRPNVIFLRGGPEIGDALKATLKSQSPFTRLTSRDALYASVRDVPLTSGVSFGFRLAVALATACAALAAVVALALTARTRARDLAYLRTMGLSTNQAVFLTMVEQLPPVLIATAVGSLLGVVTARIIEPGLDLSAFTGPGLAAELLVNWATVTVVALVVAGLVIAAIVAFGLASRRANLGQILRVGDQ